MKLNNSNTLFSRLFSAIGIISAGLLLGLPALAQIQSEATSKQSTLTDEPLLSQSDNSSGDAGDSDSNDGDNAGDNDDAGGNNSGESGESVNGGADSSDSGDSGEAAATRGNDTGGGAPYVGVGEPPSKDSLYPQ